MGFRLFGLAIFGLAIAAGAQQGSGTDTGASKAAGASAQQPISSGQNSDTKPTPSGSAPANAPQSNSVPHPTGPPEGSGLSRDLTFPGDEPAKKPASTSASPKAPSLAPPHSDRVRADDLGSDIGDSSSKDTQMDLSAPENDDKAHPKSSTVVAEAEAGVPAGGISEFHTWDPHKAAKSIEVGDYYFKRKNYRAAEARYREALGYKNDDAVATIRLALSLDKLGVFDDARSEYETYLKLLPHGPEAEQAQKALLRLKAQAEAPKP